MGKTLDQRLEHNSILHVMYKTIHCMTPDYRRPRFVYLDIVGAYRLSNTENKFKFFQNLKLIILVKRSFLHSRVQLWNSVTIILSIRKILNVDWMRIALHNLNAIRICQKMLIFMLCVFSKCFQTFNIYCFQDPSFSSV